MTTWLLDGAEIAGAISGLLGAWLLAVRGRNANFGWWAYLVSNLCWLTFALLLHRQWLLAQTIGFTGSSVVGIWNYWAVERYPGLRPIHISFRRGQPHPAALVIPGYDPAKVHPLLDE
jgi:hypothetical protein